VQFAGSSPNDFCISTAHPADLVSSSRSPPALILLLLAGVLRAKGQVLSVTVFEVAMVHAPDARSAML
jgi:hypothetical protein